MKKINLKTNADAVAELRTYIATAFDKAMEGRDDKADRYRQSYLYYTDAAPVQDAQEVSGYVYPAVRKAVDAIRPSLMNIFTENERNAVTFRPSALVPTPIAQMVDDTINRIFLKDNEGYEILERAITEALVSGDVFLKYYVEESVDEEEYEFEKKSSDEIAPLIVEWPDTDWEEVKQHKDGTLSGKVVLKRINTPVKVEFVPFCDLFVSGNTEDIRDVRYIAHRINKTVGEFIELGLPKDALLAAKTASEDFDDLSTRILVNDKMFTSSVDDTQTSKVDPMERVISIYEHYIYSSLFNKKGKSSLYRVLSTDNEILEVMPASCIPFVHGLVERIPGSFWGRSFYDKFHQAQDTKSRMMRTVEQNAMTATYPRYLVMQNSYDRRSLLQSSRPGAIIEQKASGAITPFPHHALPSEISAIISNAEKDVQEDMVSAAGVDVTGANVSATAAIITANSADLKDKVIARVLAYTLFRPLFEGLYSIIRSEDIKIGETPPMPNPATGAVTPGQAITGATLPKMSEFQIDVNTANDDGVLAQQLIMLGNTFAQWSQTQSPLLSPTTQINIAKKITGLSDNIISEYFKVPEPNPEEMQMQQQQMADQMEQTALQKDLLKAQIGNAAAITAKTEQEIVELINDGKAKRKRDEEEMVLKLEQLALKRRELEYEIETGKSVQISK